MGRLLTDQAWPQRLDRSGPARSDDVGRPRRPAEGEEGAFGELLREGGAARAGHRRPAAGAAASLRRVAERLERGEGLIGKLLHDEAYSEPSSPDLADALRQPRGDHGQDQPRRGDARALVNDRTLYDEADERHQRA